MPSDISTSRTFFLISGILNILTAIGWGGGTLAFGAVTCGIGCLIGFLPILNIIAAVMDFIAFSKLNNLNQTGTYGTVNTAAIFDIVTILTGNIVSLVFGILVLTFIQKEDFKSFLVSKGIY